MTELRTNRLAEETAKVEDVLLQAHACGALIKAFERSKGISFENFLGPLLKVIHLFCYCS